MINRAQIIDDAVNLAYSKHLENYEIPLGVITYLINENEYLPWAAAFNWFAKNDSNIENAKLCFSA